MAWWAAAALGASAVGAAARYFGGQDSARLMRRETDEEVRRFQLEAGRRVSTARAEGAASGVAFDSNSLQTYLADMSAEFEREAQWMRDSGYARARGVDQASTVGLVGDLGGAMFQYGAANNWWRKPSV